MKKLLIIVILFIGVFPVHADDPESTNILNNTKGPPLKLVEFRNLPLSQAAMLLARQSELNIVPTHTAAHTPVTLYLRNVTPVSALGVLCKTHGLWYNHDPATDVFTIHTVDEYTRNLESFRDEKTEVFTLLYPNAVEAAMIIEAIFGEQVFLTINDDDELINELEERVERFELLDDQSQGLGGESGSAGIFSRNRRTDSRNNRNRNRNRNGNRSRQNDRTADDIREFLRELRADRRDDLDQESGLTADEVLAFESLADSGDTEALNRLLAGHRPATIFITVSKAHNLIVVRTSDQETMDQIGSIIRRLDLPTSMVLLEIKVMEVDLGDDFDSVFDYNLQSGDTTTTFSEPGRITPDGAKFSFEIVDDNFNARIQLLESLNRVTMVATPVIMTANNELSRLFIGETRPIVTSFTAGETIVTEQGGNVITNPPSADTEERDIGTNLVVTPTINADRTVTLRILQESSSIIRGDATIPVIVNDTLTDQPIDIVQVKTVTGTIVAEDGFAVAFGGLIEESVQDNESQIPVLGNLPGLGFLFKNTVKSRKRTELIVMIRPFVITTPADAEAISTELLKKLSVHPLSPDSRGTLDAFSPNEAIKAPLEKHNLQKLAK